MKNILVAIDFSNATDAVIHQIGKLACPNDSIIHLLHIVEPSISAMKFPAFCRMKCPFP